MFCVDWKESDYVEMSFVLALYFADPGALVAHDDGFVVAANDGSDDDIVQKHLQENEQRNSLRGWIFCSTCFISIYHFKKAFFYYNIKSTRS